MNRTDELTDALIDGNLSEAEAAELESLLASDPAARDRHVSLLSIEAALRGLREEIGIAADTVARIETERAERTVSAVMAGISEQPHPATPRERAGRPLLWIVAVVAAILVAVWLAVPPAPPRAVDQPDPLIASLPPIPAQPQLPAPDQARIVTLSGSVEVVGPNGVSPVNPDQLLFPGQTLRTVGEESTLVLEFPDRTRLEVHPDTVVRMPESDSSRKLHLVQGRVTAVATGQNVVVGTDATEVVASRGSFSMFTAGTGSTRVEPTEGDVRVVRAAAPVDPVVLGAGVSAFVRNDTTPVRIEPIGRVEDTPRHRLHFMALDAGFTPDGEVWAVSAKQWARWKPGTADPGRIAFPPAVWNEGPVACLTPDRRFVATCRVDDRDERIAVRELPTGVVRGELPVRVGESRFLCIAPDGSWIGTVGNTKPNNRRARVWDVMTGTQRFAVDFDNTVTCLASSPDGQLLAAGVSDLGKDTGNHIVLCDSMTSERLAEWTTRRKSIMAITFTTDGSRLAAGFNGAVQIWDVRAGKLLRTIEGFERVVSRLAFSPDGRHLAAGTQDGQVWVWSAATGRRVQVIQAGIRGVRSVAFSPDGKQLVTTTNKAGVAVWELPQPLPETDTDL